MDWLDVFSKFIQAVLLALAPFVGVEIYKAVKAWVKMIIAKAKESEPDLMYKLEWIAGIAVKAAEQTGVGKLAADKKAYALNVAEKYLASKGIQVDLDVIDAAIEAAVLEEFNMDRPEPAPAAE